MATTTTPPQVDWVSLLTHILGSGASVHGPYEDAAIALIFLFIVCIEGASPEQRIQMTANWLLLWQPLFDAIKNLQKGG